MPMLNTPQLPIQEQQVVQQLAQCIRQAGGRAVLVGGCVRDGLLGYTCKDVDVEVFGLSADLLETVLRRHFQVVAVGKSFGVFKLHGYEIDVSLPRRERKTGQGHKAFVVEGDPDMSFAEAALRRDFTLNAISYDPFTRELIDPVNGVRDLEARVLRHTGPQFSEDPLRVLRAMQFIARFELQVAPETLSLCQSIEMESLPPERLFEEWRKLLVAGRKPSLGMNFLRDSGWVRYFPELEAMIGCKQDPQWHPEGDVWTHTCHCLDAFARRRTGDAWEDLLVGFGVLCHDIGKPLTTVTDESGRIRSPRHDIEGEAPTRRFLARLTQHKELIEAVVLLVRNHMRPALLCKDDASDSAVRRLARAVGRIDRLLRVVEADMAGRPPLPDDFPAGDWLLRRAEALDIKNAAPQAILLGRHLIEQGLKPGRQFKDILDAAYEAQMDGEFTDLAGALSWLSHSRSRKKCADAK